MNTAMMSTPRLRAHLGFTLIDALITVAVISLLGAIALPSSREYVARARRSAARNPV